MSFLDMIWFRNINEVVFNDISHYIEQFLFQSTVMAAVTSLLSYGIHIGVLVRGKKVRDENKSTTLYHRVVVHVEKIKAT